MEPKHYILKCHLEELEDHINDGWRNYEKAKNLKDYGENEEAREFLNHAKKRADEGDREADTIESLANKHGINLHDNALISLYDGVLYRLDQLQDKIAKMKI